MSTPAKERGTTTIADRAVRRIAERAATEALDGAVRMSGASAAVHGRRARVAVDVTLSYPGRLDEAGESVRTHVADRTARLTGLTVPAPRIRVRGLTRQAVAQPDSGTPGTDEAPTEAAAPVAPGTARRPWSERRLPVALLTLLAAAACGTLLYDVLSVHAAGHPPARWRVELVGWLSAHGPAVSNAPGAALAAGVFILGVGLLVLALAPGRHGLLAMTPPAAGVHAVLERRAAAALLRDVVVDVPGISRTQVRVRRRTARVHVHLGFGERDAAHQAVTEAARTAVARFGTARPPRLRIRLDTEPTWRAPEPAGSVDQ
ncbi:DUF6286 domain-containing protein [Streptomyces sp. NPDC048441]|uniref:DUF6286 domain-containing protein n=1 Tax=Streptomyces sp. NPDC048441 TaxID=3365552 RepID=UPI0037236569